ncbi:biopolymer transporter ExbD [Ramlibacter solisilvae]|uniref:Biopolymer transporter ExbD n=1 Tax=Ramlibacter tataouinensis TaxID=94132 RepID=A0A127JVH9_9BURK|nr:biopolymer transporter ExbD [Ramlibacter tataouinensis]AMO23990.1 biopolymer transporter ExbD [Ramlibacter tataouinensis]
MKLSLKTKGRRFGAGDPEVMMDINTTPLIDVMLVLLVMLIITIPIQLHAVNLEMPVGTPPASNIKPEKVQIDIDENSTVYWQGLPVSAAELEEKMNVVSTMNPQPEVHIRPNKNCQYAVFANVLSSSKRKGLGKMAVIGHEQFVQ